MLSAKMSFLTSAILTKLRIFQLQLGLWLAAAELFCVIDAKHFLIETKDVSSKGSQGRLHIIFKCAKYVLFETNGVSSKGSQGRLNYYI
jgi:hypothetical protein